MKLLFVLLVSFLTTVNALTFTVATYNVENFFDMKYQGSEYKEFTPHTKRWNQTKHNNKLNKITNILNSLDLDIVSLQEIESKEALNLILKKLPQYKYSYFYKKPTSAIGLSIISKYKIIKNEIISVKKFNKHSRDILKSTLLVDDKKLIIFTNHWRSKKASENARIPYAISLMKHIQTMPNNSEYIILGDLNSNYNEYKTFRYDKRLNNTSGITGINQILNTTINNKLITKELIANNKNNDILHYNLWLDKKRANRFSYIFRKQKETPDNIILPRTLFDSIGISYINNSLEIHNDNFKQSDHLLIYAKFSTSDIFKNTRKKHQTNIEYLYNIDTLSKPINLKNLLVIYKVSKDSAILKDINGRAILLYRCAKSLKLGSQYNLTVEQIDRYNELLEVKKISNIEDTSKTSDIQNHYLDANKIDIFNPKYQNEILTKLNGIYKKRYLHFVHNGKKKKIRLYSKDKNILPKENQKITIVSGHISTYKLQIQITLHKLSDYIF